MPAGLQKPLKFKGGNSRQNGAGDPDDIYSHRNGVDWIKPGFYFLPIQDMRIFSAGAVTRAKPRVFKPAIEVKNGLNLIRLAAGLSHHDRLARSMD